MAQCIECRRGRAGEGVDVSAYFYLLESVCDRDPFALRAEAEALLALRPFAVSVTFVHSFVHLLLCLSISIIRSISFFLRRSCLSTCFFRLSSSCSSLSVQIINSVC